MVTAGNSLTIVRVLALCPLWPPVAGSVPLQAAARVAQVAGGAPLDLITGPGPSHGDPTAPVPAPSPDRSHALPPGTVDDQVTGAWAQIGAWVSGDWDYGLVCSGPGDPWAHLVAASQKLLHPDTTWQAHLVAPARRHGRRPGPLTGPVQESIRAAAAGHGLELPDKHPAEWAELLIDALADEVVCGSERLAETYRRASTNPAAGHTVWHGSPWPDLTPARPDDLDDRRLDLVLCEQGEGIATWVLEAALELSPERVRRSVSLTVLEPARTRTREGLERALAADLLVLADGPAKPDPSGGLVAPYPAGLLLDHPQVPPTWVIARDGSDLDARPTAYRSPAEHPTAAMLVLDRLTRAAAAPG